MHVLIFEDDRVQRESLVRLLERQGHTTCAAWTVTGALGLLERETVDAIVLDVMVGDKSLGLEIARRTVRSVPIIVVSGADPEQVRQEAMMNALAGVQIWLSKPLGHEQLELLYRVLREIENKVRPKVTP